LSAVAPEKEINMSDRSTPSGDDSMAPTTAPSSPPDLADVAGPKQDMGVSDEVLKSLKEEEKQAREANNLEELRRHKALALRRKKEFESGDERARKAKAAQLEELLNKSEAFSKILTKKTQVLGRVGSGMDGKALGEHDLVMAKQPKIMSGGIMRDYQLEGLTWMYEICAQGMSGILADEMGLGKTIQTISLIALLREQEGYLGPHLIIAPLSTLSNWMNEFQKWTPSVPCVLYHGNPQEREKLRTSMMKHLVGGKPTSKFPVVCTSYDIILRDKAALAKINWELIIIDEGHRMKNSNSKLFRELLTFTSATRLLITGTPLQNNLKELWSLLHFLLPHVFTDWQAFEGWFDFSELKNEEGTEEFIADKKKHELIAKIHRVLQPLLLRRIKADVEHMLPKKREYVLYAPMTKEQSQLYNIINDKDADPRKYLESKVVERLTESNKTSIAPKRQSPRSAKSKTVKPADSDSEDEAPLVTVRGRRMANAKEEDSKPVNAFARLMGNREPSTEKTTRGRNSLKRKSVESLNTPNKSAKSSRASTPASSARKTRSGRKTRKVIEAPDASDEDLLSDDEFERRLAEELAAADSSEDDSEETQEERQRMRTLEQASK
jgi:ATP-dependent DNA helicase